MMTSINTNYIAQTQSFGIRKPKIAEGVKPYCEKGETKPFSDLKAMADDVKKANAMNVNVRENESLESALRRFKRKTAREDILSESRKREHYEKPSVKRKKKSEAARKRKIS